MPLTETAPDSLARVYARALLDLAQVEGGQSSIEGIQAELEDLLEIARRDKTFNEFLASRILPKSHRERSLKAILTGRVSDLTLRFLLLLNEKDRLSHLTPIIAAYDTLVQEAFGRVEVDVYTAAPMNQGEIDLIRDRLRLALGREPVIHPYSDPSMIGGLKFQIGDRLVDASVATQVRRLREQLNTSGESALRARANEAFNG